MQSEQFLGIGMTSQRTRERLVQRLLERGISDRRVLESMRSVPRHLFVDEALSSRAYEDTALPIGSGQTISQPYVVARMTEAVLQCRPRKVLEVGTGCGYQTAVLASLGLEVFSIERIGALYEKARRNLSRVKLSHVRLRHGDGYQGWKAQAPFDAILVAAAPEELPEALLQQLAEGGCLIIPVGGGGGQQLLKVTRQGEQFNQEVLEMVSFVPMLSGAPR
ncbi:MAG: protein-L-isoaspartate(D-aspartate) O-methyltransferase [Gammaproteobacteria bacterium]|nr:protein-L-isoaspartate(D-aspartate) O-methyltransferase [Gammaproteobacteria bacterium]MCW8840000.1 protein-L-isoaspartate(D-aspartate) O-methyltransferase [Gammaproteobacteria bacterium]MCW8928571.1 protein-L-isoaspartate(D-aspartate) O-methyltransferase [Gammaproteobacteria bacterium]MCW8958774.1 protein-L-isoaspartate(D-aspartate) O-methyltransferase [Gammaproteobacteria bacterium]MCW8972226.1 protein-L-isoaspartate(D-aspartate) O-methyltransferase [Gammaproteobacteria bacterium]